MPGRRGSRSRANESASLVREEHWDLLIQDLETRPPAFVLDTAPSGLHGWDRYPMEDFLSRGPREMLRAVSNLAALAITHGFIEVGGRGGRDPHSLVLWRAPQADPR